MPLTIIVANKRTFRPDGSVLIYAGQQVRGLPGAPPGNRFVSGRDGTRARVITNYAAWRDEAVAWFGTAREAFDRLVDLARRGDLRRHGAHRRGATAGIARRE